jgi:hypothetical protein
MYERRTVLIDIWAYPEDEWSTMDLTGFKVEATDGEIGTVDEATKGTGANYLVLKTGPWIFGKKIMLPAGVISGIDPDGRKVFVNVSKNQIENAPEFDDASFHEPAYRDALGTYYGANRPAGPDYGKDDRGI